MADTQTTPIDTQPNVTPPAGTAPTGTPTEKPVATFTQADVDRMIAERLTRAQAKAAADAEKATKAAEDAALAKNAEWQKLAEARAAEVAALTPQAEELKALRDLLNNQALARITKLPDEIKALDPGDGNLAARLAWLEKAEALAAKLLAAAAPGNGVPPKPNAAAGTAAMSDQARNQFERSVHNLFR